ncbi:MAG TPA: carboxypeptidase-like regulatory domain-containing protein, partial [Puia sp.]|nr:carboxypeptidase-like regulatory domain-containing protein [Puia sp.]
MKLTLVLLTAAMLHASANVSGQAKVTLKSEQTEIAGVLANIEKQTNYRFLYNNALKGIRQKVDIDVRDQDIQDVLKAIFTGTDLSYKMLENNLIVILSSSSPQQDIQVTGKVTGANGEPLPGVSVSLVGSGRGTATDTSGSFTLTVPPDGTLLITYVGYVTQQIKVNNQTVINIQLKPSESQLNEVVVVGYGTQKSV